LPFPEELLEVIEESEEADDTLVPDDMEEE
jgi:hypothetical protein